MLSLFPNLLTYEMLAPLALRVTLGVVLLLWGFKAVRPHVTTSNTILGVIDVVSGVLLIVGLFTQAAALVAAIILASKLWNKAVSKALFTDGVNYYFILFIIAVSLVFTGAGFLAFDLPL
jgi:uncharacterized membrane protein YphA (DoxX/SURF4 family)